MREVTNLMINEYGINKHGVDFMGYRLYRTDSLTFHHLIIPHRNCKHGELPDEGYVRSNGAILYRTPHSYLHVIEKYDYERFLHLTSEMIDENIIGRLDKQTLLRIHDILTSFEREYCGKRTKHGSPVVKEEYTKRVLSLRKY